jgi:hypothetical protein
MVERASDEPDSSARTPQPYQAPRLVVYGDIATLTRAVGQHDTKDNGKAPTIRTRV